MIAQVLACNGENVLLPVNEPTYGTRRRSQIETYLVNHKGEGVQHIALFTAEIFGTVRAMRAAGVNLTAPLSREAMLRYKCVPRVDRAAAREPEGYRMDVGDDADY